MIKELLAKLLGIDDVQVPHKFSFPTTLPSIAVTNEDIINGEPKNVSQCPVALAVRRVLNEIGGLEDVRVSVGCSFLTLTNRYRLDDCVNYSLPVEVTQFVFRFDTGESVDPMTFCVAGRWV